MFADGVILLETDEYPRSLGNVESVFERMTVSVVDSTGFEVAGSLEAVPGVYFWRPASSLTPGDELSVSYSVTPQDASCAEVLSGTAVVTVVDGSPPPLALPRIGFDTTYSLVPDEALGNLVCCDGAEPNNFCGETYWEEGFCATERGTGYAHAQVSVAGLEPALATTTRLDVSIDGELLVSMSGVDVVRGKPFSYRMDQAYEVSLHLVDLASGERVEAGTFLADGHRPDELGSVGIDVTDAIAANCVGPAYTCRRNGSWDPDACVPHGGGGTSGETGDPGSGSDTGTVEEPPQEDEGATSTSSSGGPAEDDVRTRGCGIGGRPPFALVILLGLFARTAGARARAGRGR